MIANDGASSNREPLWKLAPAPRSLRSVLLVALAGTALLLTVPYFLPVPVSLSDSYCFHYSNRGALLLWIVFSLGFAYWRGPLRYSGEGIVQGRLRSTRLLWVVLALAFAIQILVWLAAKHFGPIQEGKYFHDRLQHLAEGRRVFRDFEFVYGAFLLYLPLWLSRLFGISLLSGYSFSLLLEQLAGLLLLWYVVQALGKDSPHRNAIFVLLACTILAWTPLAAGQYTAFRYMLAPATAVLAYRLATMQKQRVLALLVLMAGFALGLVVSPEQPISLLGGTLLFSIIFLRTQWRWLLFGLVVFTGFAFVLLFVAYRANEFQTFFAQGSGAYAVPLTPALILVPVLGLLLEAACVFVEAVRTRSHGSAQSYLLCIAPFLLASAFSRCDPVHLLANTIPATIVAWLAISRNDKYWRPAVWIYVVIVLVVPSQLPRVYRDDVRLLAHFSSEPPPVNTTAAAALPRFYSPTGDVASAMGALRPFRVDTGRFYGTTDVITAREVNELLGDMRYKGQQPILVTDFGCTWGGSRKAVFVLTTGFEFMPARRENHDLQPLCDEINTKYEPVPHPTVALPPGVKMVRRKAYTGEQSTSPGVW